MTREWTPNSWRNHAVAQQPAYDNPDALRRVVGELSDMPPLVFSGEIERLKHRLALASRGKEFILHGGDCAERFVDCNPDAITSKLKILLQMSLILTYGTRRPVLRIGRIAGQYAKPRSSDSELIDGKSIPIFRGDNVNCFDADERLRKPDPERLILGHHRSAMSLNFIRALIDGGFADLHAPENWNLTFFGSDRLRERYFDVITHIKDAISFVGAIGASDEETLRTVSFFTSHEGLILDYESAMARRVPVRNEYYCLSAHMLWIGDRTRQLDGAHVEFFRGVANPVGIKVGPSADPAEIVQIIKKLNPSNIPGKIVLISRFGHENVESRLKEFIHAMKRENIDVVWEVDPMHGNMIKTNAGIKTRDFDAVLSELERSFKVHRELDSCLAGVHFEMTGDDVTECVGGAEGLTELDLTRNYESYCDPRLNYAQSLEMAFLICAMFK